MNNEQQQPPALSEEQLREIRERAAKATPGPLEVLPGTATVVRRVSPQQGNIEHIATVSEWGTTGCDRDADAEFIAHARNDIPALLAENAAMREIVQAVAADDRRYYAMGSPICLLCGAIDLSGFPILHKPDCPVTKARAILNK